MMKTVLNDDDAPTPALAGRIARLRERVATIEPPATIEAQLRARVFGAAAVTPVTPITPMTPVTAQRSAARGASAAQTPRRWGERWAAALAGPVCVTAAAGLVSWIVYTHPAIAPEPVERMQPTATTSLGTHDAMAATPFIALTSLDEIPAGARNEVVAATLPRTTLAEFGLPVSPMRAAEPIHAEFLVGANGGVLAVRFVDGVDR